MTESAYTPMRIRAMAAVVTRTGHSFDSQALVDAGVFLARCAEIATEEGDLRQQLAASAERDKRLEVAERQIEQLTASLDARVAEIVSVRSELDNAKKLIAHAEADAARMKAERDERAAKVTQLTSTLSLTTDRATAAESALIAAEHAAKSAEAEKQQLERRVVLLADDLLTVKGQLDKFKAHASAATNLQKHATSELITLRNRAEHLQQKLNEQRLWYEMAVLYYDNVREHIPREKQTLIDPMRAADIGTSDTANLAKARSLLQRGLRWASLFDQTVGEPEAKADAAAIAAYLEST